MVDKPKDSICKKIRKLTEEEADRIVEEFIREIQENGL